MPAKEALPRTSKVAPEPDVEGVADGASEGVADGASEGVAVGASEGVAVGAQVSASSRSQQSVVPHGSPYGATRLLPTLMWHW